MKYVENSNRYYCIDGNPDVAFVSEEDAMGYDMDMNPHLHATADKSMERVVKYIHETSWDNLTPAQQKYLSLEFNKLIDDGFIGE